MKLYSGELETHHADDHAGSLAGSGAQKGWSLSVEAGLDAAGALACLADAILTQADAPQTMLARYRDCASSTRRNSARSSVASRAPPRPSPTATSPSDPAPAKEIITTGHSLLPPPSTG